MTLRGIVLDLKYEYRYLRVHYRPKTSRTAFERMLKETIFYHDLEKYKAII